ncbi:MAG: hypothetical protein JXM70_06645 [Pirellulales bacterium]|nr:hypothetical protein [Pirellulales bacterium]
MTKPDISLEHSKAVVSDMASRIFAAYIVRGEVKDGEESTWMERSIREAVKIAKAIDASIETEKNSTLGKEGSCDRKKHASSEILEGSQRQPNVKERTPESELDSIIDEALSGNDVPTRKQQS